MKIRLLYMCAAVFTMRPVLSDDKPILGVEGGSVRFSVQMDLTGMDIEYMFWRFDLTHSILRYSNESKYPLKIYDEYDSRVGLDPTTYTLTLNNLQFSDSGIYSAKITDHRGYEKDVAKHMLHVHESVPELKFSMTLLYFNSTEGVCNVSVSCAAGDSWVSYTCDLSECYEEEVSISRPHLRMSVSHGENTVHCNASNLVSAKAQWGRMEDVCTEEVLYIEMASLLGPALIVLDTVTPFFLIFLILFLLKRRRHTGEFSTMVPLKKKYASIELLNIHEFQEFYSSPSVVVELTKSSMMGNPRDGAKRPLLPLVTEPMDSATLERL